MVPLKKSYTQLILIFGKNEEKKSKSLYVIKRLKKGLYENKMAKTIHTSDFILSSIKEIFLEIVFQF